MIKIRIKKIEKDKSGKFSFKKADAAILIYKKTVDLRGRESLTTDKDNVSRMI